MQTTPKGLKATAIKAPTNYLENHTVVLQQLKETTEIAQRLRGDALDSYVRVSELVRAGIIRFTNGVVQPANTALSTSAVPLARNIFTGGSLQGGGDLSVDRTHSLVNDNTTPGANKFYGTIAPGVKGWFAHSALAVNGLPGVATFLEADPGEEGQPGPPGRDGTIGTTGAGGPSGPAVYLEADPGEEGQPGPPGRDGTAGTTGSQGPAGVATFLAADDPEPGEPGAPGRDGAAGATGAQGGLGPAVFLDAEPGDQGDTGMPGPAGTAGVAGLSGPAVFLEAEPGEEGLPGQNGSTGPAGVAGPMGPAVFLQGEQGDEGDLGPRGIPGITGSQGPTGPPIFLEADAGIDGEHGAPGNQGIAGTTGGQGPQGVATYLDSEPGDQGDNGLPGSTGPIGPPGATGPAVFLTDPSAEDYDDGRIDSRPPGTSNFTESGTFTPVFAGTTVAGTPTYSLQTGFYTKIGNMVFYVANIILTGLGGATGNAQITGLPFALETGVNWFANCQWGSITFTANYTTVTPVALGGGTSIAMQKSGGAGVVATILTIAECGATTRLIVTGCYRT